MQAIGDGLAQPLAIGLTRMGVGISLRIAPGVRVRASSRGLRASVGPRAARVHVGAGRTTLSSGIGPVTVTTRPGGVRRTAAPTRAGGTRATLAQARREDKAREVGEQIAFLRDTERRITSLHHAVFASPEPVTLPPTLRPSAQDESRLRGALRRERLKGISRFSWAERRQARAEADAAVPAALERRWWANEITRQLQQAILDQSHAALVRHDTAEVIEALDAAFADNAHDATCVDAGLDGGRAFVTVVILFGALEMVPDQAPATTPSGRPTVRRRTKTDRNELYLTALASCVVATVQEALAVAVSTDDVNVVVLRPSTSRTLEPIYLGQFHRRTAVGRVADSDLVPFVLGATDAQLRTKGVAREVVVLAGDAARGLEPLIGHFQSSFLALQQDARLKT